MYNTPPFYCKLNNNTPTSQHFLELFTHPSLHSYMCIYLALSLFLRLKLNVFVLLLLVYQDID